MLFSDACWLVFAAGRRESFPTSDRLDTGRKTSQKLQQKVALLATERTDFDLQRQPLRRTRA